MPENLPESEFDYVIVGAGSAGAVLANRLSADPRHSVCLIEAGPVDHSPIFKVPLGLMFLAKHRKYNWMYTSTPQASLNDRSVSVPRGKVLGGSSSINGMVYIRGHRADYDAWAAAGCKGWDYDSVLPYFLKSESNDGADSPYHGSEGELSVTSLRCPNPLSHVFVDAAGELQIRHCEDFNLPEPEGVGVFQVTQNNGQRHSTAAAFLAPVKHRPNLHIETNTEVQNIVFDGSRASGVQVKQTGSSPKIIHANAELILSAGAIGSPDILLRSGCLLYTSPSPRD